LRGIPYVNRAECLLGDGIALVRDMASILKGSGVEILAASIKSPAGANHLTLPLAVLQAIATYKFSDQTVADFAAGGIGLTI
jgi:transaldolase